MFGVSGSFLMNLVWVFLVFCFTCLCFSGWSTMGVFVLFVLDDASCVVNSVG